MTGGTAAVRVVYHAPYQDWEYSAAPWLTRLPVPAVAGALSPDTAAGPRARRSLVWVVDTATADVIDEMGSECGLFVISQVLPGWLLDRCDRVAAALARVMSARTPASAVAAVVWLADNVDRACFDEGLRVWAELAVASPGKSGTEIVRAALLLAS